MRVLVVEDDVKVRRHVVQALKAAGHVVDAQGAQAGFRVALLAGLAVALLACACYRQGQRTGPLPAAAAQ